MKYEPLVKNPKPVKLTLKDKKILWHLEDNARQSFASIGKKVGLSRESVRYRIRQLEKKGVIQEYVTIMDVESFGFLNCHVFISLSDPELRIKKDFINSVKALPFVRALIKYDGAFDFEIALVAKDIHDLEQNLTKLFDIEGQYFGKQEKFLITKTYFGRKPFIKDLKKNFSKTKNTKIKKISLEESDLKLLRIIKNQAMLPICEIAQKTKMGVDSVSYRLKKLESGGLIKAYTTALNYAAVGQQMYTIFLNIQPLDHETDTKLSQFFKEHPDIVWAAKAIGKYNIVLYALTDDPSGFHTVLHEIRMAFREKVISYETLIAYRKYQYSLFPHYCEQVLLEKAKR